MQHSLTSRWSLTAPLRRGIAWIDLAFCKLNRVQFSAPWNPRRRGC